MGCRLKLLYFDDIQVGLKFVSDQYVVTHDTLIQFAEKWDPQPMHTDLESASDGIFGGLIAPGVFSVALAIRLVNENRFKFAIIAAVGWDQVRFHRPVKPGDRLSLTFECIETRPSENRMDRGIVRNRFVLANHMGQEVLTFTDILLVKRHMSHLTDYANNT